MLYLINYRKLCGNNNIVDKSGQNLDSDGVRRNEPKKPRVEKTLVDIYSGVVKIITDVQQAIWHRNNKMYNFRDVYAPLFFKKEVSILEFVFKDKKGQNISGKISDLKKKITRKNIEIYSNLWIRDVGHIKYENHVHFLVVINRIDGKIFNELFFKKSPTDYEVEFCVSLHGRIEYFSKKPLYGELQQATYHVAALNSPKPHLVPVA